MSIRQILEKFKLFWRDEAVFTVLLLILVGIVSFGLGRQSAMSNNEGESGPRAVAGVVFTEATKSESKKTENTVKETVGRVVASKSGSKYHFLNCPGAKQINEANKVYFESETLAKAAGYTLAANCKKI